MDERESPAQLTDGSFEQEVLKSPMPTLVDFWAPWCGPCKMLSPLVEDLANEYKDRLKVLKLNVDDNPNTSVTYGVRSIPTLIIFKNGEVLDKMIGLVSKDRLEAFVKKSL
jgi:thioredoxin 1